MNRPILKLIALMTLATPSLAIAQTPEAPAGGPSFEDAYAILTSNNIFRRDRRPPPPKQPEPPPPPPPAPETQWLLTGVVWEEGAFRGYFEYLPDGNVRRVTAGDDLLDGTVGELYIDSVGYVGPDGNVFWIDIGDDLTGEPSKVTVARPSREERRDGDRDEAAADDGGNGEELSAEERMRRRRQRQRGE